MAKFRAVWRDKMCSTEVRIAAAAAVKHGELFDECALRKRFR